MSLRARIVTLAVGAAAAVLLLVSVPVAIALERGESSRLHEEATAKVQGVADVLETGMTATADVPAVVERANGRGDDTTITVVLANGVVIGGGESAACPVAEQPYGEPRGPHDEPDGGHGRGGYDDDHQLPAPAQATTEDVEGGTLVQTTAPQAEGTATVCAYVSDERIKRDVAEQLAVLGLIALGILALVAVAALLVARRLARHLLTTAQTADRLSDGDLHARVPAEGPTEVRRVGAALNRLADRIEELLRIERETVADLSHRLRTPMTTLRLDVEALPDSPAKTELEDHFDQLDRTLTAVIAAARRPQREGATPRCQVAEVLRERFAFWEPLLFDQGRAPQLEITLPADAEARCAAEDLATALDALVENAIAHTDESVPVRVVATVTAAPAQPNPFSDEPVAPGPWYRIDVLDQGPGVPPAALERGRSDRGSSGLGLDIARACAESTGGYLEVGQTDDPRWSFVRLVLGAP